MSLLIPIYKLVALNKRPRPIYARYQQRCALKFTRSI